MQPPADQGPASPQKLAQYHKVTANNLAARLAAAEAGDAAALCEVGCYYNSVGDVSKAFAFHQRAVAQGDGRACMMLGLAFQQGAGTEKNMREALNLFYRAVQRSWWPALNELGRCYTHGLGVEKDLASAALMYERSAEQNNVTGITNLANCYANGRGRPKDVQKAIALNERAAAANSAVAMNQLGAIYLRSSDYAKALEWFLKSADAGEAAAMYNIGTMYHDGRGVERNLKTAMAWYLKAHEKGHASAAFELGRLYRTGIDANGDMRDLDRAISVLEAAFERKHVYAGDQLGFIYQEKGDRAKAIEWFQKSLDRPAYKNLSPLYGLLRKSKLPDDNKRAVEVARIGAERGSVDAMIALGNLYATDDEGVKCDPTMAFEWYTRALRDEPNAADDLVADCYLNGRGTTIDVNAAIKHYRRALQVEEDRGFAAESLACIYYNGEGVPVDYNEAFKYYCIAESEGIHDCAVRIGYCYELGRGVAKDEAEAVKWYSKEQENDLRSYIELSRCARLGVGMAKDLDKAVDFLRQAISRDNADFLAGDCYCLLAQCLKERYGAERDVEECLRLLKTSSAEDSGLGMYHLGRAYETGDGVVPDTAEAMRWYEKAAERGHGSAKVEIGRHLYYGIGHTQRDEAKAFALWMEVAQTSYRAALCVARCYEGGFGGVERSAAKAAEWRRKAKELACPLCPDCEDP